MKNLSHNDRIAKQKQARLDAAFCMAANIHDGWESLDENPGYEGAPDGSMMTQIQMADGWICLFAIANEVEPGQDTGANGWRAEVQFESEDGETMEIRRVGCEMATRAEAKIYATAAAGLWLTEIELQITGA